MDQFLKLAQQAGMSEEQGKTATGGIFGLLKKKLSEEDYAKLSSQFPGADDLATKQRDGGDGAAAAGSDAGGLLGAAMGVLGGSGSTGGGGGGAADITTLLTQLAGKGVTPQQIQKFLPLAAPYIQKMTGVDVSKMVGVPTAGGGGGGTGAPAATGSSTAASTDASSSATAGSSNPMDMLNSLTGSSNAGGNPLESVMGMFGK